MRSKPSVVATIVFWRELFDLGTGGDDSLCESKLWSHDRFHKQALDEEWTSEDGDVKISACEVFRR